VKVFCFCDDLWNGERGAQDWIVSRKSAVSAVVDALVG